MVGGVGAGAPYQYRSHLAGSERARPSNVAGAVRQHADEAAAPDSRPAIAPERVEPVSEAEKTSDRPRDPSKGSKANGDELSAEEEQQVQKLKETDAKVREHEQAHVVAGGPYAGAPKYEYSVGPDGKRYATSGEVEIDSSPEDGDPEATIRKMDTVIRAALSPADPSPQDLQVARDAQTARSKAQIELTKKREAEREQGNSDDAANATAPGEEPAGRDARTESAIAAYQQAAGAETAVSICQIIQSA